MKDLIELAKKCDISVGKYKGVLCPTKDQLTAFAEAIRAERALENISIFGELQRALERIAELEAALAASAQDAARYRWLRKQHWNEADMCVVCRPKMSVKLGFDCPSHDRLDAAIDAIIKEPKP